MKMKIKTLLICLIIVLAFGVIGCPESPATDAIHGVWIMTTVSGYTTFTINTDGTFAMDNWNDNGTLDGVGDSGTFTYTDTLFTVVYDLDGKTEDMVYTLDGDTLTLENDVYTRQ